MDLFERALKINLRAFKWLHKYLGFPLRFGRISKCRRIYWYIWCTWFAVRTIYTASTFCWELWNGFSDQLLLAWHLFHTFAFVSASHFGYCMLLENEDNNALLWRSVLRQGPKVRKLKPEHVFLYLMPASIIVCGFVLSVIGACVPKLTSQLRFIVYYGRENGHLEDYFAYIGLTAVAVTIDCGTMYMMTGANIMFMATHLGFFEVWNWKAAELIERVNQPNISYWRLKRALTAITELSVMLRVFNVGNSRAIFFIKIFNMTFAIGSMSSLLMINFNSIWVQLIAVYVFALAASGYPALYGNAYNVSQHLIDFKKAIQRNQSRQCILHPEMLKRIIAIQEDGVWVGSFRTFEQDAIPVYFDFIFQQVVSIVLAGE